MSNKLIIISTSLFLLVSFVYLSVVEKKEGDINTKNLWMVYFENAKDTSLNFEIENHSTNTTFHWQVLEDTTIAQQGDANLALGQISTIPVTLSPADIAGHKIMISVTTGNENKQIYKTL